MAASAAWYKPAVARPYAAATEPFATVALAAAVAKPTATLAVALASATAVTPSLWLYR
jgi:hypothetical protein